MRSLIVSTSLGVAFLEEFAGALGRFALALDERRAREVEFGDDAENGRAQMLPFAGVLGDGDEIGREEDAAHARQLQQRLGERRMLGLVEIARLERAFIHDGSARQELQGGGIGGRFGLDEQGPAPSG